MTYRGHRVMKFLYNRPRRWAAAGLVLLALSLVMLLRFDIKGHFEGIYLLRDLGGGTIRLADHLFVGEGKRLIWGLDLAPGSLGRIRSLLSPGPDGTSRLECDWAPHDGNGKVVNTLADGSQLVTYFGRYLDNDEQVHGLFVGGSQPDVAASGVNYNMNNSGMTYFDGRRWYHIWCNVNEGIGPAGDDVVLTPSRWRFLESRVVTRTPRQVTIISRHEAVVDRLPVRIERTARFFAGEPYFILEIALTNGGERPLVYEYYYGDEPWVGFYGTSLGDTGWVADRLVNYEELLDTGRYSYAGIVDSGNRVIGERPVYTNLANFIEWTGPEPPLAYFANRGVPPRPGSASPLESNERYIGLQWERRLAPGATSVIKLAVGMATSDNRTGHPVKPAVRWQ
jgi:hypothetical protein